MAAPGSRRSTSTPRHPASPATPKSPPTTSHDPPAGPARPPSDPIATDTAGNVEVAPSTPDATTVLDTAPPTSAASAPPLSASTSLTIGYSASDGGSGLAQVDLYAKTPGQSSYTKVASDNIPRPPRWPRPPPFRPDRPRHARQRRGGSQHPRRHHPARHGAADLGSERPPAVGLDVADHRLLGVRRRLRARPGRPLRQGTRPVQ